MTLVKQYSLQHTLLLLVSSRCCFDMVIVKEKKQQSLLQKAHSVCSLINRSEGDTVWQKKTRNEDAWQSLGEKTQGAQGAVVLVWEYGLQGGLIPGE